MYTTFLGSSAPSAGILAPNMPPRTAMPWSGLSLITCSVPSLPSRKSVTAERCKSVAQQDLTGKWKCVLPAASLADMTESEKTGVESDFIKSHRKSLLSPRSLLWNSSTKGSAIGANLHSMPKESVMSPYLPETEG